MLADIVTHDICFQASAICCHPRELKSEPSSHFEYYLFAMVPKIGALIRINNCTAQNFEFVTISSLIQLNNLVFKKNIMIMRWNICMGVVNVIWNCGFMLWQNIGLYLCIFLQVNSNNLVITYLFLKELNLVLNLISSKLRASGHIEMLPSDREVMENEKCHLIKRLFCYRFLDFQSLIFKKI